MKKEYIMNFNMETLGWNPVRVRAGLQIGSGNTDEFMPLLPNFTVEDSPDICSGVGGIGEGILSITEQKIDKDGKIAEFYVSIIPPGTAADRDKMIKIIGDQMSFDLKVTLNPVIGFFPGAPVPIVDTMVKSISGTITIFLELPPDRIMVEPEDEPILVKTDLDNIVSIVPTCERIDFSTLQYELIRDPAGKPIVPLLGIKSPLKESNLPLRFELIEKDGINTIDINPVRFQVGDGTPIHVYEINVKRPHAIKKIQPDVLTKMVHCTTNPLEMEFRVMRGNREIYRETKTVYGDYLDVSIVSEDPNMDWTGITLFYQIHNAGAFFDRSHYDTKKVSLEESRELEIYIIKNTEDVVTKDSITLEIKKQPFSGIIHIYKRGWRLLDDDIATLFPDTEESLEERLTGALLEVTAKAEFVPSYGNLSIDVKDIDVCDISGRFITPEEEIAGSKENGVLTFQMPGEPVKGKIVRLEVRLLLDEFVKETLEEIHSRTCELDMDLGTDVSYFGKEIISFLARSTEDEVGGSINDLFYRLQLTETLFTKYIIIRKYLKFSFTLRNNAAKRIFDNFINLLVELAFLFVEWGISQGSVLNAESKALQENILIKTELKHVREARSAVLKDEMRRVGGNISLFEQNLARIGKDLETSKKILVRCEKDMVKIPSESLQDLTKRWSKKASLEELSIKKMSKQITEHKRELRILERQMGKVVKEQDLAKKEFEILLKEMRGEIGITYTAVKEGYGHATKQVFSYDNISDIISTASERLKQAFFDYINAWEENMRSGNNVRPVISEVYRTRYSTYLTDEEIKLSNRVPSESAELLSGKGLISLVKSGVKPPTNWHETQWEKWSAQDKKQELTFEKHMLILAKNYLKIDMNNKEWITDFNLNSFKTVCAGIDQLIFMMKDYEDAFAEGLFVEPLDISTWQDVDNLVEMMSFLTATLVRVAAGITLLTGVGVPMALLLSKIGDAVDLLGAITQIMISSYLTMPEMNGIAEAVPLLASMLHNGLSKSDVTFDEPIIKA